MNTIPYYIIDKILTFTNPDDIIHFMNISNNNYSLIKNLTLNDNSFIQKQYELKNSIICKNTWLDSTNNKTLILKYSNFFKIIFKQLKFINKKKYLIIFSNFRNLLDNIETKEQSKIIDIPFILILNNYHFYNNNIFEYQFFIFKSHLLYIFDIFLNKKKYCNSTLIFLTKILDNILNDIKLNPDIYLKHLIQDAVLLNQIYFNSNKYFLDILCEKIEKYDLSSYFLISFVEENDEDNIYNNFI